MAEDLEDQSHPGLGVALRRRALGLRSEGAEHLAPGHCPQKDLCQWRGGARALQALRSERKGSGGRVRAAA